MLRLGIGVAVMLLAVSAGRFFGVEQANTLAERAIPVAAAAVSVGELRLTGDLEGVSGALDGRLGRIVPAWASTPPSTGRRSPRELKEVVRDDLLAALFPSFDRDALRKLDRAIERIERSLNLNLWVDDWHLTPEMGRRVFDEELRAAAELQALLRLDLYDKGRKGKKAKKSRRGSSPLILTDAEEKALFDALYFLAFADEGLAARVLGKAEHAVSRVGCYPHGDYRDLTAPEACRAVFRQLWLARDELARGRLEVSRENFVQAMEHFKMVWLILT